MGTEFMSESGKLALMLEILEINNSQDMELLKQIRTECDRLIGASSGFNNDSDHSTGF